VAVVGEEGPAFHGGKNLRSATIVTQFVSCKSGLATHEMHVVY
jgi:hypothetical protein